ncbi:MAG: hypothetical protein A2289_00610 [Deltaproteobacteria bacterium RIFOXYA12_FULL_58_15]|nr:MAG: hypothetical protein A2289_00610 [Deltaproteobacteria bacterium RIFOXYA12_FULL_58_15]
MSGHDELVTGIWEIQAESFGGFSALCVAAHELASSASRNTVKRDLMSKALAGSLLLQASVPRKIIFGDRCHPTPNMVERSAMTTKKSKLRVVGESPEHVAKPTISETFDAFLADLKKGMSARTFRNYASTAELLQHCLNGYAYQDLDEDESKIFEKESAKGKKFCDIFGPDKILSNVGEFLDYFMIRKVMASKEILGAAGTMTKKLAKWLGEKGYADREEAEDAIEQGAEAARDLPKAEGLAMHLHEFTDWQGVDPKDDDLEDHFSIVKVERGAIWLDGMLEGKAQPLGPITVPAEISSQCKVGWSISGVVGKRRGKWKLVEAWNVYPS